MRFSGIIGQDAVKNHLISAVRSGKIRSAYIFDGEEGSGKMMVAKAFASYILCENGPYSGAPGNENVFDSCGECPSCKRIMHDNSPDVIYVTQQFIEVSTPQSNYGMRGQLSLFQNPIIKLRPDQQEVCRMNFDAVKRRLAQTGHCFRHDALRNAIECMIIDFFDFHAQLYPADKISTQQHQLMEEFFAMLERGDFRKNRDISYYADKLCVTSKYLSEVCKKVSGLPAAFWITRYTSLDISRLLRDRSLTFTDICEMFGFSSLSHFSRYVQTNLGAKPSELRE